MGGVVLQRKRPMAALLHYCQALSDCGTVGRAVGLSDDTYRPPQRDCCQTLSDTVGTVGLSDCRNTVGILSDSAVGLSDQGSVTNTYYVSYFMRTANVFDFGWANPITPENTCPN